TRERSVVRVPVVARRLRKLRSRIDGRRGDRFRRLPRRRRDRRRHPRYREGDDERNQDDPWREPEPMHRDLPVAGGWWTGNVAGIVYGWTITPWPGCHKYIVRTYISGRRAPGSRGRRPGWSVGLRARKEPDAPVLEQLAPRTRLREDVASVRHEDL